VLIVHKDAKPTFTAEQVQNLVARGVPNLKPENVSVSLAQQPPRPIPRREMDVRRRNNIIFAIGTGLLMILGALLVVLILQTRRQRAQLTELRESIEAEDELGDEAETAEAAEQLGQRRLAGDGAQTETSARQLSSAFAEQLNAGSSKTLEAGETKSKAVNE
jgi:flagellar biosynthesis/type III secretory pathway M-ring protein FliF/YscJ